MRTFVIPLMGKFTELVTVNGMKKYTPSRSGWVWLQRFGLWLAEKAGCWVDDHYQHERLTTVYWSDDWAYELMRVRELMRPDEFKYLFVGPKEYQQIVNGTIGSPLSVTVPLYREYRTSYQNEWERPHLEILGIEIVLVPWMSGVLPMSEFRQVQRPRP